MHPTGSQVCGELNQTKVVLIDEMGLKEAESLYSDGKHKINNLTDINF